MGIKVFLDLEAIYVPACSIILDCVDNKSWGLMPQVEASVASGYQIARAGYQPSYIYGDGLSCSERHCGCWLCPPVPIEIS